MSKETKVDVLAVLDSLVGVAEAMAFRLDSNQPAHEWAAKVRATRNAVAELIEAHKYIAKNWPDSSSAITSRVALAHIGAKP